MVTNLLILGAAGRDFHNFNVRYRHDPAYRVVGFTATQIPDIAGRRYPPELAGPSYPRGIPIFDEAELPRVLVDEVVDEVVFAYSDVSHEHVMHLAAQSVAAGARFTLLGDEVMLDSSAPVVAVTAVRTGAGKSQTSRHVRALLAAAGKRVAAIRHPMPYGDLAAQAVQRFATEEDLVAANVTIEEREEYEPYLREGAVIYAGVDYAAILRQAEAEADVIVWDGGNNDLPFVRPTFWICVVDPFRAGHETRYWPGEANLRRADVVVINKIDSAPHDLVQQVRASVAALAPKAEVVEAASPIAVEDEGVIRDRSVLVVDDGPTITHGEMPFGAGYLAAERYGARKIIDPKPYAVGSLVDVYERYPHIGAVLPAMGYGDTQREELAATIRAASPEAVVIGTPIDLAAIVDMSGVPHTRVFYDYAHSAGPTLETLLQGVIGRS